MISKTRAAKIAAFAGACAIATAVAPAGADEVKPVPTSCAGLNFTDPAGDQQLSVTVLTPPGPLESGHKTPDNTDILAGFFRYAPDASGKNVLTANIQVANLDNAIDQGSSGSTWYYYFDLGDATLQVSASLDGAGNWSYGYGNLGGEEGPGNNTIGDTTGAVYPGKDGIISIVVPAAAMGIDGKTLSSPYASSRVAYRAPNGSGAVPTADDGPDNQAGKTFKVVPCAEAGETTPVSTLPSVPVVTPDLGPAPVGPATLNLKVTAPKLSARKLRRTRSFAVRLRAGEQLSGLAAKLRKGSRTIGSGKLAAVAPGAGTLRVKLSRSAAKKLKKGTYTLAFSATKVDGRTASGTVAIRVAK